MRRWKVERGIYRDGSGGWEIFVRVKPLPLAHRHYDASLSLKQVREKRTALQRDMQRQAKHRRAAPDTLAADVETYLRTLTDRPRLLAERRQQLREWLAHPHGLSHYRRHEVPVDLLQGVLGDWAATGLAYYTIKHRRAALRALYVTLDKRIPRLERPPNPVGETTIPVRKPDPQPRGLALSDALEILDAVSRQGGVVARGDHTKPKGERGGRHEMSLACIRIHVMAFTAMRHSELKRYLPADWRRQTHDLEVRAGKGCHPRIIPLTPDAEHWLAQLEEHDGVGDFNNGVLGRAWRRALVRVGLAPALPKRRKPTGPKLAGPRSRGRTGLIRPYDLRHTLLTALTAITGNTDAAQWQGGHKDRQTSMRYNLNAVHPSLRAASGELAKRLADARAEVDGRKSAEAQELPRKVTGTASH